MAKKDAQGLCFEWAYQQLRRRGDVLVHGVAHDPWSGKPFPHAWIERGDHILDWQSSVGMGPGPTGWVLGRFYEVYKPEGVTRYTFSESRRGAAKT